MLAKEKTDKRNADGRVIWKCLCDCGNWCEANTHDLQQGKISSCGCIKSKGEMLINKWLVKHQINFHPQYSTEKIVLDSGRHPFFDFAIFNNNN